jgi:hypothetical protein
LSSPKAANIATKRSKWASTPAADGQYYCEPHYKQLVVSAGSLDDVSAKSTKAGGKSPAVVTSTPTSFVPVESSSSDASSSIAANKQETPAHIAAKFKGGDSEKCLVCGARVYATERLPVDTASGQVVLHKACLKCATCSTKLEIGQSTMIEGKFYCKRHAKDQTSVAHSNAPGAILGGDDAKDKDASESGAEDGGAGGKFGGANERCAVCTKRVYATERVPIDTATGQIVLHKPCLKCADCSTKLEMGAFTLIEGKFYCKRHAKDHASTSHSNAPGAILDDGKDKDAGESGAEDGAGGKFGGANERCAVCTKRVYATERVPIDTATGQIVLHKPCLKCADCSTKLEVGAFTLIESKFYCKRHAKDHASVSHGNTPGAIPDESGASPAKEGESGAEDAGGKFGGAVERCAVCSKRVYATERMPIDGTNGQDILHKSCLKCADCQSVLKMDTFTRIDGAFYCKRHAKDHTSVSHNNAPGAIPDEKAGGDAAASDSERCLVCKKKVFATERMPIDGVGDASVIHRTCLKCADCSTTLKVDTYTRIGDAFYCKRHAQDHAGEYAPTAASAAAKSGDAPAASKSIKVDRDICPVCSKAVYATEKLIVSDAFDSKTLHKTCFRCKTCDTKLDMRTYVSAGDGQYFCKPHKPEILRAKGAGDMYAAYGSEYGADANGGSKPQSTAARLEAEGHAFQQEKKPEKDDDDDDDKNNTTNNANNDNNKNNNDDDDDDNKKAKAAAESDNEEVAGGAEESEEKEKEKEPEPVKEEPKKEAAAAGAGGGGR